MVHAYGLPRATADIDLITVTPNAAAAQLIHAAGKGSQLHAQFGLYLDLVTVTSAPEAYANRIQPLFPNHWKRLRLFALEAHDLALTKLERNLERDRSDIQFLARGGYLKADILRDRYRNELRPYLLSRHDWHDQTLQMWIDAYF